MSLMLLNLLIYCFKFFKDVVLHVGPENVVHIVTGNAANYVATGRLLEKEFPKLFWSPCAAHCINLMLQDMGNTLSCCYLLFH